MVGFFADPSFVSDGQEGIFYGGGKQLGYQIIAVMAYCSWAIATFGIMFARLGKLFGLASREQRSGTKGIGRSPWGILLPHQALPRNR